MGASPKRASVNAMDLATLAAVAFTLAISIHFVSAAIAAIRCRRKAALTPVEAGTPAVSLVRPVCGIENSVAETLESAFTLDYPHFELLFCVAQPRDAAIPLIEKLMRRHPQVRARILIGDDRISGNPKLNNMVKGWHGAKHDLVIFADSNVLMPRDYIQTLLARWDEKTGLVCAPPAASNPITWSAEIEAAFLNSYQARWQYCADTLGVGFAQGKNLLYRRDILEAGGGIAALARETAEDAASTKLIRGLGLKVRLAGPPFAQPLGVRVARDVWKRQVRWAQLRRASFPLCYTAEIFSTSLPTIGFAAIAGGFPLALAAALAWYGAECALARVAGWPLTPIMPFAMAARDLALPAIWIAGWRKTGFVWRGNAMQAEPASAFAAP